MTNHQYTPSSLAAATKVVTEAIQTPFGAAVTVLFFFGLSLVMLCTGLSNLDSHSRTNLIEFLILAMLVILCGVVVVRICKPRGLSAPPSPETSEVSITNSEAE
jgi:Na+/proline symporter